MSPHVVASMNQIQWLNRLFSIRSVEEIPVAKEVLKNHVVIAGFGLTGQKVIEQLGNGHKYVIVDTNLNNVERGVSQGRPIYFGDVTRREVLDRLELDQAKTLIIAINDADASARTVKIAKEINPDLHVLVRGQYETDRPVLKKAGADAIVIAETEAAEKIALLGKERSAS